LAKECSVPSQSIGKG